MNWSQPIADVDLLGMHGRRQDLEATLQATGLDHSKLPKKCDPGYRHTLPSDEEITQRAHADHMRALMSGQTLPNLGSQASSSHTPPQSLSASTQQPNASVTTGQAATSGGQVMQNENGTAFRRPPTPAHCEYRTAIQVSRQAARDDFVAMERDANGYSMGEWYVWYISLEIGETLFVQKFTWIKPPKDDLVKAMCEVPDHYPFDPENGVVRALTADMVENPSCQAIPITPAEIANPGFSEFWLTPGSTDIPQNTVRNPKDDIVAGFTSSNQAGFGSS